MNLTIALDDHQSAQLQRQASARRLSLEEYAHNLLGDAISRSLEEETWGTLNRRRIDLIRKSRVSDLTADEATELEQLQSAVDRRLEPVDRQLLATAEQFRDLVERLPDHTIP
jgi:hypothetical protein